MSSEEAPQFTAHITAMTPLPPALHAWEIYLLDQGKSPYTVKAFIGDLQLLSTYLPPDRSLGAITTNDLNLYIKWLQTGRGVSCSPKSLARRITSIKSFFRWLQKNGTLAIDPAAKVLQQSVISPLPQILTPEEEQLVMEAALTYRRNQDRPDARPFALVGLLLTSGIKKGECLAISLNHIDLDVPEGPLLFVRYTNPSMRYKERKIELPGDWVECYREYLAQYQPVDQVFPWSPRRLEYLLEEIGLKAGLEKHLSFDMCRWTCAVNDHLAGMPDENLRQKLGISKIQWREISMKLRQLAQARPAPAAAEDMPVEDELPGE